MTQDVLKLALEALEENHHLIEEHERPEYLVHYDQIISLLAKALAKEKALQALHDENERLGLYKDAYAQPEQEPVAQPASEEDMKIYKTIAANYHKDLSTHHSAQSKTSAHDAASAQTTFTLAHHQRRTHEQN
jgi:5-bromo-4-chloroindolyl phosphate hydrolysis protein